MSRNPLGVINPNTTSGSELASRLTNFEETVFTESRGVNRPSYAVAGLVWVDEVSGTQWDRYLFDGAQDVLLGSLNPSTHVWTPAGLGGAGSLAVGRGLRQNGTALWTEDRVEVKTAAYTVAKPGDHNKLVRADATGGQRTITLPETQAADGGFTVTVQKADLSGNKVSVTGQAGQLINGQSTQDLLAPYESLTVRSDGGAWHVLGGTTLPDKSVTLQKLADGTPGKFVGFDGSGAAAELDGSAWTYLGELTASNADFLQITSQFTSAHDLYHLAIENLVPNSANAAESRLRVEFQDTAWSTVSGRNAKAYYDLNRSVAGGPGTGSNTVQPYLDLTPGLEQRRSGPEGFGFLRLRGTNDGANFKPQLEYAFNFRESSGVYVGTLGNGLWDNNTDLTGVRFYFSNAAHKLDGKLRIWGAKFPSS